MARPQVEEARNVYSALARTFVILTPPIYFQDNHTLEVTKELDSNFSFLELARHVFR